MMKRERKEDGIFPRIYIYIYMCIVQYVDSDGDDCPISISIFGCSSVA